MLLDWLDALQINPILEETLTNATGHDLLRTNDHVFEIASGSHPGLDWHVGYYSFSYIPIEEYACTLWVPLDPVGESQRGGMRYISKKSLNGRFIYPFSSWHFDALQKVEIGKKYIDETVSENFMVNAVAKVINDSVPAECIEEDTFNVGDAFLFDKDVIHKSAPFLEGAQKVRAALVIRFVDKNAKFDKNRLSGVFSHIDRSAKSNSKDTEYFEKREDGKLVPVDPFISKLVLSDAENMSSISAIPGLEDYMKRRQLTA